jgi:hypothetical protein
MTRGIIRPDHRMVPAYWKNHLVWSGGVTSQVQLLKYLSSTVCTFHETIVVAQTTLLELSPPPPPSQYSDNGCLPLGLSSLCSSSNNIKKQFLWLLYFFLLSLLYIFTKHAHPGLCWRPLCWLRAWVLALIDVLPSLAGGDGFYCDKSL